MSASRHTSSAAVTSDFNDLKDLCCTQEVCVRPARTKNRFIPVSFYFIQILVNVVLQSRSQTRL